MTELFGWVAGYPDRYPNHYPDPYPDPYPDGYPYPYPDGYPGHPGTWGTGPLAVCPGRDARGAGSRANTARDPAPLRYVGVRLADPEPVDGPPSSAHDERNYGRRPIGPALRAGRAFARIQKTRLRLRRYFHISSSRVVSLTESVSPACHDVAGALGPCGRRSRRRCGLAGRLVAGWAGGVHPPSGFLGRGGTAETGPTGRTAVGAPAASHRPAASAAAQYPAHRRVVGGRRRGAHRAGQDHLRAGPAESRRGRDGVG